MKASEGYTPLHRSADEDDEDVDGDIAPPSSSKAPVVNGSGHWANPVSRLCYGRRLSKTCIALCVLGIVFFTSSIGGGGYWAYKTALVDGQSPPWYPSPLGGTTTSWKDSYDKAQQLVDRMTLVEKVNITTGVGWAMGLCVGNTAPAVHAGFPGLCLQDGPLGLRFTDHATSFPAGVTAAASWNRDLMRRRAVAHARQAKLKGIHVLLGPSMGPMGRHPAGGRNWEGFGADPVLQAVAAYETILGIQSQGVQATAKHFVANEQEHFRKPFEWGLPEALSANVDDRSLHEIYAWPFAQSVRAGVASVMCSYQMINNSYACQNSKLINGILKDELGFQGYVQSDWLAQRSGVASVLAGLDMTMPGDGLHWLDGKSLFGERLSEAVLNGSVPVERINDMTTRVVAAWYQLGQDSWTDEENRPNFSSWTDEKYGKPSEGSSSPQEKVVVNKFVQAENDESRRIARQVAAEGTVLLKNEDGILPLDPKLSGLSGNHKKTIVLVGEDAGPGKGPNFCDDRACNQGTLAVGWGSGATDFTYLVDPLSALNTTFDHSVVDVAASLTNRVDGKVKDLLANADLCLAFANADSGEGHRAWNGVKADRNDLDLQKNGGELIQKVAEVCAGPVIVVIHAVGPVNVQDFAMLPNVKAILNANLPGQESGNALADVLFGKVDASGRLPYTIGKTLEDYGSGAPVMYYPNNIVPQANFDEGLFIDYRHFDRANIAPLYPFGYGLSYTTFEWSDLNVTSLKPKSSLPAPRPNQIKPPEYDNQVPDPSSALAPPGFRKLRKYVYPYISSVGQIKKGKYHYPHGYDVTQPLSPAGGAEGGNPSLYDEHVQIDLRVKNTGRRAGKEVVQVYVALPANIHDQGQPIETPVRVLRNFTKVELEPNSNQIVSLTLSRKDLSYWSVLQQNWVMPNGQFTLYLAKDSRNLVLQGTY
ncbi:hypothetical protein DV736_g159, partial [Chaetothyriales sp. CBS 134916]